jgi:sarcosine oxidase subunit gamma
MFANLCGVDLAPDRFANGRLAQTFVAQMPSIVIRNDRPQGLAYSILTESSSAEYLWDCLLDAMAELGGRVVGADRFGFRPAEGAST